MLNTKKIDPRKESFAQLTCQSTGEIIQITHKMLLRSMWRREQLLKQVSSAAKEKISDYHELYQTCVVSTAKCKENYIVIYSFSEFAMGSFAFEIAEIIPD